MKKTNIEIMKEACLLCDLSDCSVKTACLAVKDGKVISSSTNMLVGKDPTVPETKRAVHAEKALIQKAQENNINLNGITLFLTRFPCIECAKLIRDAEITQIYYMSNLFTAGNIALPMFEKSGIKVEQIKEEDIWNGQFIAKKN